MFNVDANPTSTVGNLWKRVHFYCINHEEPIPMIIMEGNTPFYACPKYMRKDEKHPDGHEEYEPGCGNRLSFESAFSIVTALANQIADDGPSADHTNFKFKPSKTSAIYCVVLTDSKERIDIGVLNRRAVLT